MIIRATGAIAWGMNFFEDLSPSSVESLCIKPGLHIVVTIAEPASDVAPKRILRLAVNTSITKIFVKYEYL